MQFYVLSGLPSQLSWYGIHLQCRRPLFDSWVGKIRWRRDRLPTPVFLGFPYGSAGKESTCNEGDLGLVPGLGRSPGEGKGYPLQYSGLENSMKLKKVEKTTIPFRYDLNQIPYDYTVEVRNRFKGLDLIDRVPDEL